MRKIDKKIISTILAVAIFVLGAAFILRHRSPKSFSGRLESVAIGTPALETNTLIYIAEQMGYFERNGLRVTLKEYDSGGASVPGLMRNEVDLAIASEFVLVNNLLQEYGLCTFGSIDRFENMFLITRKDKAIGKTTDLRNRTIGVPVGTIAAFYLGRYLNLHGVGPTDVTLLDVRPNDSIDALVVKNIDAVVTWHPYLDRIMERYGDRIAVWPIQSSQLTYWNIIGRADWARVNRKRIDQFLLSVSQAEEYLSQYPEETKAVVKKRLGYEDAYLARVWRDNLFSLSLDQGLVAAMEDEARWMMKNKMTKERTIPDFMNSIYVDGLKAVKPEAVKIIR